MDFARHSKEPRLTPESDLPLHPVTANLAGPARPGENASVPRSTVWLSRIFLVIYVMFCIELGMLLTVLPWTRLWTDNSLFALHPTLGAVLRDNFFRGLVTGFGLVDVWIGIWEAVHYRDPGKKKDSL
jgi:hypothetical protein